MDERIHGRGPLKWLTVASVTARCNRCGQRVATLPIDWEDLPGQSDVYRMMVGVAKSSGWQRELACTCDEPPKLPDPLSLIPEMKRHTRGGVKTNFTIRV